MKEKAWYTLFVHVPNIPNLPEIPYYVWRSVRELRYGHIILQLCTMRCYALFRTAWGIPLCG